MQNKFEIEVLQTISYFSFFDYLPNSEEIYTFLKKKTSFGHFKSVLEKLTKQSVVTRYKLQHKTKNLKLKIENCDRYTIGEYSKKVKSLKFPTSSFRLRRTGKVQSYRSKFKTSEKKLGNWRFKLYIKLISLFPQIKLVGLSGSVAMMNAKKEDDIDLFVITARNQLFTGRFITLLIAQLLGLRRKRGEVKEFFYFRGGPARFNRAGGDSRVKKFVTEPLYQDKVCLNLFFDESDLTVPKFKRSDYVAHEVLQMKPIINKGYSYEKFLEANLWVRRIFPNSSWTSSKLKAQSSKPKLKSQNFKLLTSIFNFSFLTFNLVGNWLELLLRKFQLNLINRHRTTEIITDHQLWFHPEDFGKKLQLIR